MTPVTSRPPISAAVADMTGQAQAAGAGPDDDIGRLVASMGNMALTLGEQIAALGDAKKTAAAAIRTEIAEELPYQLRAMLRRENRRQKWREAAVLVAVLIVGLGLGWWFNRSGPAILGLQQCQAPRADGTQVCWVPVVVGK